MVLGLCGHPRAAADDQLLAPAPGQGAEGDFDAARRMTPWRTASSGGEHPPGLRVEQLDERAAAGALSDRELAQAAVDVFPSASESGPV